MKPWSRRWIRPALAGGDECLDDADQGPHRYADHGRPHPVGIKIFGPDLKQIEDIGKRIEMITQGVPGTRSVYAERVSGGYFLDFDIKREEIARYGLTVMDIGQIIESAIGGESIATTIEGRERYPINVRYLRELRDDPDKLRRVLVTTPTGAQVPLGQLTTLRLRSGPAMIRDEDGMLSGYVYVDMVGRDIGGYVEDLKQVVREQVELPAGYPSPGRASMSSCSGCGNA